jgi:plasmid stabilization system protein ParE
MNLTIRAAARRDIVGQADWYLDRNLPAIAERFVVAAEAAIRALLASPNAGTKRQSEGAGTLRSWPVKGFAEINIYYIVADDRMEVVRVLHDKRDLGQILGREMGQDP